MSRGVHRVLDECDEMLNMGFVDDVEKILNAANNSKDGSAAEPGTNVSGGKLQTLLFSATMPAWVKDITRRFLTKSHKLVDLVGDDKLKVRSSLACRQQRCKWMQQLKGSSAVNAATTSRDRHFVVTILECGLQHATLLGELSLQCSSAEHC